MGVERFLRFHANTTFNFEPQLPSSLQAAAPKAHRISHRIFINKLCVYSYVPYVPEFTLTKEGWFKISLPAIEKIK